eukprot:jgi/Galph1/4166/GphlegSOOS_G2830.1
MKSEARVADASSFSRFGLTIQQVLLVSTSVFFLLWIGSSFLAHFVNPKLDKEVIRQIGEKAIGLSREEAFQNVSTELKMMFPHLIHTSCYGAKAKWVFINAGGWMGSFCLLHASLTEYVLLFGTAVDTTGHSGRYWIDIYDTVLRGTFYQWQEGTTQQVCYVAGDTIHHPPLAAAAVNWKTDTWMLEYARGPIISSLLFALSDSIFSTQDWLTVVKSIQVYGSMVLYSILHGQW